VRYENRGQITERNISYIYLLREREPRIRTGYGTFGYGYAYRLIL